MKALFVAGLIALTASLSVATGTVANAEPWTTPTPTPLPPEFKSPSDPWNPNNIKRTLCQLHPSDPDC